MSTARILILGAIAGLTIYVGLPMGRFRSTSPTLRAALSALATFRNYPGSRFRNASSVHAPPP